MYILQTLAIVLFLYMICKICGVNETENPDGICDDCKFSIISIDEYFANILKY